MRTTVEINDALLRRCRKVMLQKRTTLRQLVEEGLRRVVEEPTAPRTTFDFCFKGKPGFAPGAGPGDVLDGLRSDVDERAIDLLEASKRRT